MIATFAQKGVENKQYNPFAMLNLNENGHTKASKERFFGCGNSASTFGFIALYLIYQRFS